MACADCGERPATNEWGRWGRACQPCADAWWEENNRYRVSFGRWLQTQRGRQDAVGNFARFCDAARIDPGTGVGDLIRLYVDLDVPHDVQDAGLAARKVWLSEGWAVTPR